LHIAAPGSLRFLDGNVQYGTADSVAGSNACTGIQRYPLAPNAIQDENVYPLPVIAANNIAGHLRRAARDLLTDALKAKGKKIDLPTYSAISCGAVTGKPDQRDLTFAEYCETREHPYLGLFGGGPRMLKRRAKVHNALPVIEALRQESLTIPHPTGAGRPVALNAKMTGAWAFRRNDDIASLADVPQMEDCIENFHEALRARQALIMADNEKKKNDEKGSRYSTLTWSAFEFVLPGLDFDFTIDLIGQTPAQIGMFLKSLEIFANDELGGQTRNGLGRIALREVVLVNKNKKGEMIEGIFNKNALNESAVQVYMDAFDEAMAKIDESRLMALLEAPDPEEVAAKAAEKKAKAAEKKAKPAATA
jgi:CRISPR type IV-associated protein Csf2